MSPFTTDGITADKYANWKHEFNPDAVDIGVGIQISDTCLDCGEYESDKRHDLSDAKDSNEESDHLITVGTLLICRERMRQIDEEGFDAAHDAKHDQQELLLAALCYIESAGDYELGLYYKNPRRGDIPSGWPFGAESWKNEPWKPSNTMRMLVKAGAFIAAEIDRLLAENESNNGEN